jgi:hypothetical protein
LAIRRLIEPPKKGKPPNDRKKDSRLSISLVILLSEMQANAYLLTRERMRQLYVRANRHSRHVFAEIADRVFTELVGSSRANTLPPARAAARVRRINHVTKTIDRYVNKRLAHHERHRRRFGRPIRFDEIDNAINVLMDAYEWASRLVTGNWCHPNLDDSDFDIRPDLRRLWPDATHPDPPKREFGPEYDGIPG